MTEHKKRIARAAESIDVTVSPEQSLSDIETVLRGQLERLLFERGKFMVIGELKDCFKKPPASFGVTDAVKTKAELLTKKIVMGGQVNPEDLEIEMEVRLDESFFTYCPICKKFVEGSEYLYHEAFPDDYFAYWIANLVKHHRHKHIRYYDLSWRYWSYGDRNPEYQKLGHDGFKILVNNRAKRQLIRAILKDEYLSDYGKEKLIRAVLKLQHNDEKTLELVNKALRKLEQSRCDSPKGKKKKKGENLT